MKYAYEDMSDTQFEKLVVLLCQRLLGIAVQGFSEGADGGRDAKFVGTAELHPSKASPWHGTTIIQAKHTNGLNRSFSESDFFSITSVNTVIGEEIQRINNLRANNQLDNYMLFANRRMSGIQESKIRACISQECKLPEESIYLCGIEQLEIWLKGFPEVPRVADLDPIDSPLIVSPDDLAVVIEALDHQKENIIAVAEQSPVPRVHYEEKNRINYMSKEYAKELRRNYLKETSTIDAFLSAPENNELKASYESVIEEFQLKIIAKRKEYQSFDDMMNYLVDLLFSRDAVLRQHKRLTRAMIFYMYWNCDIGKAEDAETY